MRKKNLFTLIGSICLTLILATLLLPACAAEAPAPGAPTTKPGRPIEEYALYANPFGTTAYIAGFAFEDICRKYHPWFRIRATENPGGVYTVTLLEKIHGTEAAKTHIQTCGATQTAMAQQGITFPGEPKWLDFPRTLVNYSGAMVWAYASFDLKLKTVDDLVGKTVAVGTAGQSAWGVLPTRFFQATPFGDQVKIHYVGSSACVRAVADGLTDACIVCLYVRVEDGKVIGAWPAEGLIELMGVGRPVRLISLEKEYIHNFNQATGLNAQVVELPAGILDCVVEPVELYTTIYSWGGDRELLDSIAYEFTKTYIDNMDKFQEYSATGKTYTIETLTMENLPEWFHPGAVRAYWDYSKEHPEAADYLNGLFSSRDDWPPINERL